MAVSERSVIVYPPTKLEGRQVWVDGEPAGTPQSLRALTELLRRAGWEGLDEVDVADLPLIEWYGGGPEVWTPGSRPWPAQRPAVPHSTRDSEPQGPDLTERK
ncbi:hypothetical protein [Streptomyces sp. NPDC057094]|uniref:hypothetical protein n=1 Tax=Streptomyces sp. NPDC057094 TaxID=3346018 RepID=UPI0036289858